MDMQILRILSKKAIKLPTKKHNQPTKRELYFVSGLASPFLKSPPKSSVLHEYWNRAISLTPLPPPPSQF